MVISGGRARAGLVPLVPGPGLESRCLSLSTGFVATRTSAVSLGQCIPSLRAAVAFTRHSLCQAPLVKAPGGSCRFRLTGRPSDRSKVTAACGRAGAGFQSHVPNSQGVLLPHQQPPGLHLCGSWGSALAPPPLPPALPPDNRPVEKPVDSIWVRPPEKPRSQDLPSPRFPNPMRHEIR